MFPFQVTNGKGESEFIPQTRKHIANIQKQVKNAGFSVDITTLTQVLAEVREEKYYVVKPSDFVDVRVGVGAWADTITSFTSGASADDGETGFINTAANHSRLASVDVTLQPQTFPVRTWAKHIDWSIPQLEQASKAASLGNAAAWDLVAAKERVRKTNWDLMIQKAAFVGVASNGLGGLLNGTGVTVDTATLPAEIGAMSDAQLQVVAGNMVAAYFANAQSTALPDQLIIPQSQAFLLSQTNSVTYPLKTKWDILLDAFKAATQNPNFQIKSVVYANTTALNGSFAKNRYTLSRKDQDVARFEIPVDYTMTMAHSFNGFQFANAGFGQIGGVHIYRPLEIMYFQVGA